MVTAFKLTHANSINWTISCSMPSDSASAQKRCTKLMKDCQDFDSEVKGKHLGCNTYYINSHNLIKESVSQ